jgi:hypothetical protein
MPIADQSADARFFRPFRAARCVSHLSGGSRSPRLASPPAKFSRPAGSQYSTSLVSRALVASTKCASSSLLQKRRVHGQRMRKPSRQVLNPKGSPRVAVGAASLGEQTHGICGMKLNREAGCPIALPSHWATDFAVELHPLPSVGSARFTRCTYGYSWVTLRVESSRPTCSFTVTSS